MTTALPLDLADLLAFYREAGVDEPLQEEAVNRFEAPARPSPPLEGEMAAKQQEEVGKGDVRPKEAQEYGRDTLTPGLRSDAPLKGDGNGRAPLAVPDETQALRARELARSAATLAELRDILASFDGCNLRFTAKNLIFADGNPDGGIMFVGEAPGRDEDLAGLPFVGVSGQLLDRMLAAIGLDRSRAYIANVIPWRPPGNRTPTPLETEICRPFIERQIELANPKVLVTLGNPSTKLLLNPKDGILRVRGSWREYRTAGGRAIAAMPTLHPAYLLRNPAHKRLAWRDFLEIKARLAELTS